MAKQLVKNSFLYFSINLHFVLTHSRFTFVEDFVLHLDLKLITDVVDD